MAEILDLDLEEIPKSRNLLITLKRAMIYAQGRSHRFVTLEHLLYALIDDPDAAIVLEACHVDVMLLRSNLLDFITTRLEHLVGPTSDSPVLSEDLQRVATYAMTAAQESDRQDIDGAIFLATLIGDAHSPAAEILTQHGLTFAAAIENFSNRKSPPQAKPAPHSVPKSLATSLAPPLKESKSEDRTVFNRGDIPQSAPAEDAPSGSAEFSADSTVDEILASVRNIMDSKPENDPSSSKEKPSSQPEQEIEKPPAFKSAADPSSEPPLKGQDTGNRGQSLSDSARSRKVAPPRERTKGHEQPYYPQPSPPQMRPPQPLPSATQPIHREVPRGPRPTPPPPIAAAPAPVHPPIAVPEPVSSGPMPVSGPVPTSRPRPMPAGGPRPVAAHRTQALPNQALPNQATPPEQPPAHAQSQPYQRPHLNPMGPASLIQSGQLVENIPRKMRVGRVEAIDLQIVRAYVEDLEHGLAGGGPVQRNKAHVTEAIIVQLRAPQGGFLIENASSETQWIDHKPGLYDDDDVAWRWMVTPTSRGKKKLQFVLSSRTIDVNGIIAESAMPEQIIDVKVRINYKSFVRQIVKWTSVAAVGGFLSTYGVTGWAWIIKAFSF